VQQARDVWASAIPALYRSTQDGGLAAAQLGVDGALSAGIAEAVAAVDAAWSWRQRVEADEAKRRAEAQRRQEVRR